MAVGSVGAPGEGSGRAYAFYRNISIYNLFTHKVAGSGTAGRGRQGGEAGEAGRGRKAGRAA